jgi:NhaA family Na+:H+ antiporter
MPLQRLESLLHTPVNFIVVPLFALANAGLVLGGVGIDSFTTAATSGIVLGLLIGKPIGITLFAWLSVMFGWSVLPKRVSWRHIVGVGFLGGIGFTMSLFVADLAFRGSVLVEEAKLGILAGSLLAGLVGVLLIGRVRPGVQPAEEEG